MPRDPARRDATARSSLAADNRSATSARIPKGIANRLLVRSMLYAQGPASRIELGKRSGLPLSTLTTVGSALLRQGVVREAGEAKPSGRGRGRRRSLLEIDRAGLGALSMSYARGTITATICDILGTIRWTKSWPLAGRAGAQAERALVESALTALADSPIPRTRLLGIGVADPGLIDRRTGRSIRAVEPTGFENVPVVSILAEATRMPVFIERADGLEALGEAMFGAGIGARGVLFVSAVANGIGGGLVQSGEVVAGRDGAAGEIGHVHVGGDLLCGCGLHGCFEAHASPRRLLERYRAAGGGRVSDLGGLAREAAAGDVHARSCHHDGAEIIARVLGGAINLLNPDCVVLGGQFADAGPQLIGRLQVHLERYALPEMVRGLSLRSATLGDRAVAAG
ncbi:MAG: ROK family protein, partial [Planctomycetes bacterium]|nr:ROK family protein [Planctomycetota bacterium]